jgi:hypothetical protein
MTIESIATGKTVEVELAKSNISLLVARVKSPGKIAADEAIYFTWNADQLRQLADKIYELYPVEKEVTQ